MKLRGGTNSRPERFCTPVAKTGSKSEAKTFAGVCRVSTTVITLNLKRIRSDVSGESGNKLHIRTALLKVQVFI